MGFELKSILSSQGEFVTMIMFLDPSLSANSEPALMSNNFNIYQINVGKAIRVDKSEIGKTCNSKACSNYVSTTLPVIIEVHQ